MSLKQTLQTMVDAVPGATAAIFLDREGEAVMTSNSALPAYDLQVIGAYSGIFLTNARRTCEEARLGETERLKIVSRGSNLYISALNDGYYVVLVSSREASEALAWRHLARAAELLNHEI